MNKLKDKKFIAMKAVQDSAANKDSSFGEHEIFSIFEVDVTNEYNKRLKRLKKLAQQSKDLYNKIFMPAMESVEEVEMNDTLKRYNLKKEQLENQKIEISSRRRFAANKIHLEEIEEIKGSFSPYIFSWIYILAFILIESCINATLLVQASDKGLIGGALYAAAISTISVVFSTLCGIMFQRYKTALAGAILIFWILCSVIAHVSIGWYRFALEKYPDEASTKWFELLRDNFFNQHDFWAWVLTIAGLILAVKAFQVGTKWLKSSLLKELRFAEKVCEKNETTLNELRQAVKDDLTRIKNETMDIDIKFIIKTTSDLTTSFELKRVEILQLCRVMNEFVESTNRNISTYIDLWRSSYSNQTPDAQFSSEIPKIDSDNHSLYTHPIHWIQVSQLVPLQNRNRMT